MDSLSVFLLFFQRLIDASEKPSETIHRHYCHRHCTTKGCRGASLQRLSHSQWGMHERMQYTHPMSPFENVPTTVASSRFSITLNTNSNAFHCCFFLLRRLRPCFCFLRVASMWKPRVYPRFNFRVLKLPAQACNTHLKHELFLALRAKLAFAVILFRILNLVCIDSNSLSRSKIIAKKLRIHMSYCI